jgi:hypothetical protein
LQGRRLLLCGMVAAGAQLLQQGLFILMVSGVKHGWITP